MTFFEDMLAADAAMLLSPLEFADVLDIGGSPVRAMWDATVRPGDTGARDGETLYGINVESRVLFALAADMPAPVSGQELEVAGAYWNVGPVVDEHGVLRITLTRNIS